LFLPYYIASFTSRRASVHLYFSSLPVDLWVVVLEPGVAEDHTLPSNAGDSKECPFRVSFVMEDYVHHFRDLTGLVGGAVHIVYWYGVRDALGVNTFRTDKVYEVAHSSGVQKCLDRMHLAGVCGTDFYQKDNQCPTSVESVGGELFG